MAKGKRALVSELLTLRLTLMDSPGACFALKVAEFFHGQAVEEFDTPLDSKGGLQELGVIFLIGAFEPCWIRKAPVAVTGLPGNTGLISCASSQTVMTKSK